MIDVQEGDVLVVGEKEYPIRSCAEWDSLQRTGSRAFRRMAIKHCTVKRTGTVSDSSAGATATVGGTLRCTPLDPVSPEIQKRIAFETPMELLQTFLTDGDGFVHLVVEDLKVHS